MKADESPPAGVDALSEEHQQRLAKILDDYLIAAEQGSPITPEQLLANHADDAVYLKEYLSGLNLFHQAAQVAPPAVANGDSLVYQKPGQTIGDFRLIREVGRGGMGVVYEAEQLSLKRRVALKVLPYVAASDEKHLLRFKTESQTAASIEHPHIVPVYAIGEEHGVHFYAMQFIEGESLTEWLGKMRSDAETEGHGTTLHEQTKQESESPPEYPRRKSSEFSSRQLRDHIRMVARLGTEAAVAMHAAHEYGVVHRDIKPSNLLIDEHSKLWITDFGLARCREGSGLTQTGDILGTLRYMSPEQAGGNTTLVDHRTDVFSLGITLYEAACLRHPLHGNDKALLAKDRSRIKQLRSWDNRIPADFETIVMKAVADQPGDRFATALDLAKDLQRFLADEPIEAKPPGLATRMGKWARRHRRAVLAGALALVVMVGALSVALGVVLRFNAIKSESLITKSESLEEARRAIDRLVYRANQLESIPGAGVVRLQMLEESIELYKSAVDKSKGDERLVDDLAFAYSKLGELTAMTGDQEKALEYSQLAQTTVAELIAAKATVDPERDLQRELAVCWNNIANQLLQLHRNSEALEAGSRAFDIQRERLADDPNSTDRMADLATTYTTLGRIYRNTAEAQEAAEAFAKAVEYQEKIVEADQSEESRRQLALGYGNLASIYESSDPAAAQGFHGAAIRIQKSLVSSESRNLVYQRELAKTYNNLAYLSSQAKQWQEAVLSYEDAIKIQEHLVEVSPRILEYRRELAVSQNNLGMTLTKLSRYEEAKELFYDSAKLQQQILATQPRDVQALMSLGGIFNNLGTLLQRQGSLTNAGRSYQRAVEHQTKALQLAPSSERIRALLSNHLSNQAMCLHLQKKSGQTLAVLLRKRELCDGNPQCLLDLSREILKFHIPQKTGNPEEEELEKQLFEAAGETLKLARECGLVENLERDKALSALSSLPKYQELFRQPSRPISSSSEKVSVEHPSVVN